MSKINFHHLPSAGLPIAGSRQSINSRPGHKTFTEHLYKEVKNTEKLSVSKHAQTRLADRQINISTADWRRMEEKISEAKHKGVTDSLVLLKDAALIVSAENNTVITAMNRAEAASQIFTNINGTIVLN